MTHQRWTVAMSTLAGVALVATASVGAGTTWASLQTEHRRQATEDLKQRRTDADARAAAAEKEQVEVRLAFDPNVATATSTLTERLRTQACDQARAMVKVGKSAPVGPSLAVSVLDSATEEFPSLAGLPGWEAKVDLAAVDQRIRECTTTARAKKAAAPRKVPGPVEQTSAADDWATIESNGAEGTVSVYDPDHTIRNGGSDPDRCIHNGKQYCSD